MDGRSIVACVLLIALGISMVGWVVARAWDDPLHSPSTAFRDLAFDHASARAFLEGRNPYAPADRVVVDELPGYAPQAHTLRDFPQYHPPFRVLVQVPFALLPWRVALIAWIIFSALCIAMAMYLFADTLGWPRLWGVALAAGVFALPLFQIELELGQTEGLLLLLLVLAWRDRQRTALWLGLAISLKFYPAFWLLPLLGARRYRTAAGAAALAGILTVVSWLVLGAPGGLISNLSQASQVRTWMFNVSLHRPLAQLPALAFAASILIAGIATLGKPRASDDRFWLAAPLMMLASPIAWAFYGVLAIPWFVLAVARSDSRLRGYILVGCGTLTGLFLPKIFQDTPWPAPAILGLAVVADLWPPRTRFRRGVPEPRRRNSIEPISEMSE